MSIISCTNPESTYFLLFLSGFAVICPSPSSSSSSWCPLPVTTVLIASKGLFTWTRDLTGRLAWSRRSTVGVGPTPYKWLLPELDLHLSRERAALAPFSRSSGVGHSGLWPPLHCGDSKHLHRRLFQAPHCTLRLSHLSVGGNARDWRLWASSTCRSRA